ncbi:MAG: GNAT family N-acetyltransferase [Pseudomonadota bacterium]|nr:GNAT family N-acetyltransferase [Pseudomonadota bacterium]
MNPHALTVHWREHAGDCVAELWQHGFPPPWEGLWWYQALEQGGLDDQFRFLYAEVRDAQQRPLALAPAFLMDVPLEMFVPEPLLPLLRALARVFPALLHQRTLFFGSPCSERGWVGFAPGCDQDGRAAVLDALERAAAHKAGELRVAMRVWKDFPAALQPALDGVAARRGLFRVVSFPGTRVELPAAGKEAYFMALKPSRRQQLRRKLRRSAQAVTLRCEVVASPDEALRAQLFGLFWQTYEHATTRFERLTPTVFEHFATAPEVAFIVLRAPATDIPVAFMMVNVEGPVLINKFIGFDYTQPREWLLYFRLWDAAVDLALSLGKSAIESGQTGYRAKIAVGHQLLPLWNYCRHRNPLLNAIYRAVGRRIDWASLDPELAPGGDEAD